MVQRDIRHLKLIVQVFSTLIVLFFSASVHAAENTQVQPIGYSPEGRYFSYEEYGFNPDTGIAYSKIYLIDLVQVSQVVGTPIFNSAELSALSLAEIRGNTRADAKIFLDSLMVNRPAIVAAMIGDGQLDNLRNRLEFGVPAQDSTGNISGRNTLSLEMFEASSAQNCSQYLDRPVQGLKLRMESFGTGLEIYTDKVLTRSRECPFDYKINSVILPFGATDISNSVGLISVLAQGPEGLNRHYLAIPLAFGIQGIN